MEQREDDADARCGMKLESLQNVSRPYKRRMVVGRGPGSRRGKTCRRGQKGMGARSGYQRREGWEGGGVPLFKRLPTRGFSNARFACKLDVINLGQIEKLYADGETVSLETLKEKGYLKGVSHGIKVLGVGALTKKVKLQVEAVSQSAKEKLEKAGISY
jgi:large subunit ribosomal protein L15